MAQHAPRLPLRPWSAFRVLPSGRNIGAWFWAPAETTLAPRSHIPALDGVRGLAIIVVMLCHFVWIVSEYTPPPDSISRLMVEAFKTGRYGVDLFFVLSGFLITGILFDAKSDKHYFRNFYARRTLRIFPLYYSVLLILFVILPLFVAWSSAGERKIVENQAWLWTYMSNMKSAFAQHGPEFFQQDRLWVGHFWSLAIEEQFYLVWPMVILLLSRRAAMGLCIAMICGAPLVRLGLYESMPFPNGLYASLYFTLAKVDTLALGAFFALAARSPGGLTKYARFAPFAFVILGMLLAPLLFFKVDKTGPFGGINETLKLSIICLFCGTVLVMAIASTPKQFFGWLFTQPVMRFFGKYSYGIYIFHELLAPLFNWKLGVASIMRTLGVNWHIAMALHILAAGTISVLAALLSWHLMEKHMLKLKKYFEHAPVPRAPRETLQLQPELSAGPVDKAPVEAEAVPVGAAGR